jgi:arsenate reductase
MKKIFYLKTCDTCKRILKSIPIEGFELQEIKSEPISLEQLELLKNISGSYESLFSRRAKKYKSMGLKGQKLSELDIKQLILSDYTFLKRPVIVDEDKIFIGSDKKNLASLKDHFN